MITFAMIFIWTAYLLSLFFVVFWFLTFFDGGVEDKRRKITRYPLVSIIVPAYNEERTIKKTMKSILDLDYPSDKIELIVINDGSKDRTKDMVEQVIRYNPNRNIILVNQKNQGKGRAMNHALEIAKGEFFVCLDADSFVDKDALKLMIPVFDEDKRIASVLPCMKIKNPTSLLQKIQWTEYLVNFMYKRLMGKLDCIHVTPGPFAVYRKEVIKKLGGFNENNLTEDLEICLRLQKNHYRIVQLLNAMVYTVGPSTFQQFYKQRNRWYKGSLLNAIAYRKMIFNKEYGDFGVFQMPQLVLVGLLSLGVLLFSGYHYAIKPILNWLRDMSFINYNVSFFLNDWISNSTIVDVSLSNLFLGISAWIIVFIMLVYAYKYTQEKMFSKGVISIVGYLFLYHFLIMIAWAGVYFDLIRGKKQKW